MILLRSRGLIRRPTEKPQQKPGLVARFWGVWNHTLSQWERRETPLFQHASLIRRPTATRCCEFSRPRCSNAVSLRRKEPLRPSLAHDERKQLLLDLIVKPIGVRGSQHLARWRHRTRVALAVAYPSHDVIVVELHRFALSRLVRPHWNRTCRGTVNWFTGVAKIRHFVMAITSFEASRKSETRPMAGE